jgi:hypothetical protein
MAEGRHNRAIGTDLLFDAPFRFSREDLSWLCHSYLCFLPDAVLSPRVRALAGLAGALRPLEEQ